MNAVTMMNSAVAWFAAAAVLALIFSFHKTPSGWIAGIGGAIGSLMTLAAGGVVLLGGQSVEATIPVVNTRGSGDPAECHLAGDVWFVRAVYQPV